MSKEQDQQRGPTQWSSYQFTPTESDPSRLPRSTRTPSNQSPPSSAAPSIPGRPPDRTNIPTRSATMGTADQDRALVAHDLPPHARSEDLNHNSPANISAVPLAGSSPRPSPAFLSSSGGSRPSTPAGSSKHNHPSSSGHSDDLTRRTSVASFSSAHSGASVSSSAGAQAPPTSSTASTSLTSA
jgi:hypothetical protein